jgi:hypothetical protein
MATEDFPVLLAPSDSMLPLEVFDQKYLKLKHGFLPMALNFILMAPCLRAGRVLDFFWRNLISRHLSLLIRSPLAFRLRFRQLFEGVSGLHLLGQSGRFIGVKLAHSVIEAGASVPELSAGTFYS